MAKVYSDEFKRECASLYIDSGFTSKEICDSRECSASALRKWIKELKDKRISEDITRIPEGEPVDWGEDEKGKTIGSLRKELDEWKNECQGYRTELEIYKRQYSILKNALTVVLTEPNL